MKGHHTRQIIVLNNLGKGSFKVKGERENEAPKLQGARKEEEL